MISILKIECIIFHNNMYKRYYNNGSHYCCKSFKNNETSDTFIFLERQCATNKRQCVCGMWQLQLVINSFKIFET